MGSQSRFYRRKPRANKPEENLLKKHRNKFLLIPPLIGAASAYFQKEHIKSKAEGIEQELGRERREFLLSYSQISSSIQQDPELVAKAREAASDGQYNLQDLLMLGQEVEARYPGYTAQLQERSLQFIVRTAALRSELRQTEEGRSSSVAKAFVYGTAATYAFIAFMYGFVVLQRKIREHRLKSARGEAEKCDSEPPAGRAKSSNTPSRPPREEAKATTPSPSPPPAQKGERRAASETPVVDLEEFAGRKKNDRAPKPEPRQSSIFEGETAQALKAHGFDAKELEKALIRAFKILSKNGIYVGMRYAQVPDVRRDLVYSAGENGAKIFAFLESEDVLQFHKGRDCVSLNPRPVSEIGKQVVRDITANLVRMGKQRAG